MSEPLIDLPVWTPQPLEAQPVDRPARRDRRLAELMEWARDRWDVPPVRIHGRGLWADETGGSVLGSPALTDEYRSWIEDGAFVTVGEQQAGAHCVHPRQTAKDRKHGQPCPDCNETGLRDIASTRYRWPMRAALAVLKGRLVARDRPAYNSVVWQLAAAGWLTQPAFDLLAVRFPCMGDRDFAMSWATTSLLFLRGCYREETTGRPTKQPGWLEKSDSQRAAEVAA